MGAGERLYFLPGRGADARLFTPQLEVFRHAVVPSWPDHRGCRSLGDLAERLADSIDLTPPTRVVGFSFGSMIALEMARRVPEASRPQEVILISGLRSKRAVTGAFKRRAWAAQLAPKSVLRRRLVGPVAENFRELDGVSDDVVGVLSAMAADCDLDLLKWALLGCARWTFDGTCPAPVRQLHGRHDTVIPLVEHDWLPDGRATLAEGGHLLTLTNPEAVNAFITGRGGAGASG
jgi:pimeloyl-ACP methyl ester carboxylesterase